MSGASAQRAGATLLGALLLAVPLAAAAVLFASFAGAGLQRTYTLFLINLVAVLGLGAFSGNSGILSFGHVAFIGLGAYASAILTLPLATKASALPHLPAFLAGLEWSLPAAFIASLVLVAAFALAVGLPIMRMGGAAAVIATLGLLLIVHGILIGATDFTRGANAFLGVPRLTGIWTALTVALLALFTVRWFRDSPTGRQLRASREDETAAKAIGVDVLRRRLVAWTLSAMIAAASGVLLAHFLGAFSPSKFYFDDTLTLLTMLIVGGMTTVSGAVLGTIVVTLTIEVLRRVESGVDLFGWETPELFGLTQAGLCVLILVVMYRRPAGMFARLELGETWIRKRLGGAVTEPTPAAATPVAPGVLRAEGITKNFTGLRALDNVSLSLAPGEIVGLIGPNGSGKTTLVNVISGLILPDAGKVIVDDADVTEWPSFEVARAGVARTFQNIRLFGQLSVLDNVETAALAARPTGAIARDPKVRARSLLARFGLLELANRPASALDYGAQRRLEIARALALDPRYLLLDEPAAGMNPTESNELLRDLAALRAETGIGLLVIDHDMSLIMRLCDRIVVLNRGEKIAEGGAAEVQTDPAVIEAYIGRKRAKQSVPIQKSEGVS